MLNKVSFSECPNISFASARCVSMLMDTTFSSSYKIQVSGTLTLIKKLRSLVERSLPELQVRPEKAALQAPLRCDHLGFVLMAHDLL
jgi:hypothetical protein